MRFTTFNVFWLGTPERKKIRREPEDEAMLAEVLRRVDADAFVLQEVVSLPLLEELLQRASRGGPRRYTLRDAQGSFLTTGRMRRRTSHIQKIVLAYDQNALELVEMVRPFTDRSWPGPRAPACARFRHKASAFECTLVGAHFKSGAPAEPADAPAAVVRASESAALAAWLLGSPEGSRGGPPTPAVVLLGDMNAVREHLSLSPLEQLLPAWTWHHPTFQPDDPRERWTSFANRTIIDHALTSPAATAHVQRPPCVYAFDLDPDFDRPSGGCEGVHWMHRKSDLMVQLDDERPPELVENLFRVSDHRPLSIDLVP